jgi:hypothetical protein
MDHASSAQHRPEGMISGAFIAASEIDANIGTIGIPKQND